MKKDKYTDLTTSGFDYAQAEEAAEQALGVEADTPLKPGFGANLWTGNLIGAVLILALGAYMIVSAFVFGFGTPSKPGAGLFPALIGGVLLLLGAIWLGQIVTGRARRESDEPFALDRGGATKIGITIAVIVGFALVLDLLGYQLTMLIAIAVLLKFIARSRWWVIAIIAVVFSLGTFTLFDFALGVPMPTSSIPFLDQLGL